MWRAVSKWVIQPLHRLGPHYLFFSAAGLSGFIWPSPSIIAATYLLVAVYVWLGSYAVGGALCAIGRWQGPRGRGIKMAGLGLLILSNVTFVLALFPRFPESAQTIGTLLGLAFLLIYKLKQTARERDAERIASGRGRRGSDLAAYTRNPSSIPGPYRRRFDRRTVASGSSEDQAEQRHHTKRPYPGEW